MGTNGSNAYTRPTMPPARSDMALVTTQGYQADAVQQLIGGLPETLRQAGLLLDIPEQYRPGSNVVPSAEEVVARVEAITHLRYDEASYQQEHRHYLAAAEA